MLGGLFGIAQIATLYRNKDVAGDFRVILLWAGFMNLFSLARLPMSRSGASLLKERPGGWLGKDFHSRIDPVLNRTVMDSLVVTASATGWY